MALDDFNITELSRLLKKSRPTIYKYVTDYKEKRFGGIPYSVKELFDKIQSGCAKSEVYAFCESNFFETNIKSGELQQIVNLIIENKDLIDLEKLKKFIIGEIENGK